jgi:cytochrome c551/c552
MGSLLFNGNCATCHHVNEAISAPSIIEIQQRYKKAFPQKKDFVKYMSNWVVKPKEETSLMQDKIKKYGLMPELGFDK